LLPLALGCAARKGILPSPRGRRDGGLFFSFANGLARAI